LVEFFFAGVAQGVDAGIFTGQDAAGSDEALEAVGGRLDGGADFLEGVARGDVQPVPADQLLEASVRFVLEDAGFGEQAERERIHGGAGSVGAGSGLLSGSSHGCISDHIVSAV
jgi:hypothetical protein